MNNNEAPADHNLVHLVQAYCNGTISAAEFRALEERLLADKNARAFYRRYMNLHCALGDQGSDAATVLILNDMRQEKPRRRTTSWKAAGLYIAAGILIATVLIALWWNRDPQETGNSPIAKLEQSTGNVRITSAFGSVRIGDPVRQIQSGDTVRTHGAQSSAVLALRDGTRLSLAGSTSLTIADEKKKSVVVHNGTLFASVTKQLAGKPLVVLTPQDKVEVLGTRFSLKVTSDETQIAVSEGRVRLTRLSDGKSVEVAAGQQAVSNPLTIVVSQNAGNLPDTWNQDFERGLPKNWVLGKLVSKNLPLGAEGAVQAVHQPAPTGASYGIVTDDAWTKGMFTVHEDTHLHVTFLMQKPNWVNVFILARTKDGDPPAFASNYLYVIPQAAVQPGRWYTLSVPLVKFRRLSGPKPKPFADEIPFQIILESRAPDRGLVVDRIWVTRGGSGKVKFKALK